MCCKIDGCGAGQQLISYFSFICFTHIRWIVSSKLISKMINIVCGIVSVGLLDRTASINDNTYTKECFFFFFCIITHYDTRSIEPIWVLYARMTFCRNCWNIDFFCSFKFSIWNLRWHAHFYQIDFISISNKFNGRI